MRSAAPLRKTLTAATKEGKIQRNSGLQQAFADLNRAWHDFSDSGHGCIYRATSTSRVLSCRANNTTGS